MSFIKCMRFLDELMTISKYYTNSNGNLESALINSLKYIIAVVGVFISCEEVLKITDLHCVSDYSFSKLTIEVISVHDITAALY